MRFRIPFLNTTINLSEKNAIIAGAVLGAGAMAIIEDNPHIEAVFNLAAAAVPVTTAAPVSSLAGSSSSGVFLGAMNDHSGHEGVSPAMITDFINVSGRPISHYQLTNNFFPGGIHFPAAEVAACKAQHVVPLINMAARLKESDQNKLPPISDMGPYTHANIAAGKHDAAFAMYATACKAFASPIMMIFGDEVNGDWFPWSNEPGAVYVNAYRHLVTLFKTSGATNVKWIYDVAVDQPVGRMQQYYPGDQYIDIMGGSTYGEDQKPPGCDTLLNQYYAAWASVSKTKPMGLFEWGLGNARDYTATLSGLCANRWPRIKFSAVWNESVGKSMGPGGQGNVISSSPASLAAYKNGIKLPCFISSGPALAQALGGSI